MKINKSILFNTYWLLAMLLIGSVACKKKNKDPQPETKTTTVTNLNLMLDSNKKGFADAQAMLTDVTGVTGKTAATTVTLDANNSYTGTLTLEDGTKTPKATVTNEFTVSYQITGVASVTVTGPAATPTITTQGTTGNGFLAVTLTKGTQTGTVTFPITVRQ